MRILLLTVLLLNSFFAVAQQRKNIIRNNYVVFYDTTEMFLPIITQTPKNLKYARLDNKELKLIDSVLRVTVQDYNIKREKTYKEKHPGTKVPLDDILIDLDKWDYKRQCIGYYNDNGEKMVWVNCVCAEYPLDADRWKLRIIRICDGGNCFFNLTINLDTKKASDFKVNAWA